MRVLGGTVMRSILSGRRGRCDDSGASAVEFALLFPIFAMLTIGLITFGFALESYINVSQAARETSRFGATYPVATAGDIDAWLDKMGNVAAENAGITIGTTPPADYFICVKFVRAAAAGTPGTKMKTWGTLKSPGTSCTDSTMPDNRVEVQIVKPAPLDWLLGSADVKLTGDNTSRYEPALTSDHRFRHVRASGDSGVYAILYAVLMLVLVGTAAVVVDLATLRESRTSTRSAADSAVVAAASHINALSPAASNPREACRSAWLYLRQGLADLPDGSGSCSPALPVNGSACTTPQVATSANADWTVRITWPVPNLVGGQPNPLLLKPDSAPAQPSQQVLPAVDGSADGCSRIAVEVFKTNDLGFAGVFGVGGVPTRAASVGRAVPGGHLSEDVAALNILEPTKCEALTTSGQGGIQVNGFGTRSGIISVESDGKGGNPTCNGAGAVIHPNDNALNFIHANGSDGTIGGGLIESYALNPSAGNPGKAITNASRVSPAPTPLGARSGVTPVTSIYDCTGAMVCADGGGPSSPISRTPTGRPRRRRPRPLPTLGNWRTLPGDPAVPGFVCNGNSSTPAAIIPVGNWYINCSGGLKTQTLIVFQGGRVVTKGDVQVGSSGCLVLNVATTTCPTLTPGSATTLATMTPGPNGDAALLYIGGNGTLTTGSQAKLFLPQTFTFIKNGSTSLGGGAGSALFMTTPLATGTPLTALPCASTDVACSYGVFHKMVLWSEGSNDHIIGGQSAMGFEECFTHPTHTPTWPARRRPPSRTRSSGPSHSTSVAKPPSSWQPTPMPRSRDRLPASRSSASDLPFAALAHRDADVAGSGCAALTLAAEAEAEAGCTLHSPPRKPRDGTRTRSAGAAGEAADRPEERCEFWKWRADAFDSRSAQNRTRRLHSFCHWTVSC